MVFKIHSKLSCQLDTNRNVSQKDQQTHSRWRDFRKDLPHLLNSSLAAFETCPTLLYWISQIPHGNITTNFFPFLLISLVLRAKCFLPVEFAWEHYSHRQMDFHLEFISFFHRFWSNSVGYHYQELLLCESHQNLYLQLEVSICHRKDAHANPFHSFLLLLLLFSKKSTKYNLTTTKKNPLKKPKRSIHFLHL